MRLFIAIHPGREMHQGLVDIQDALRRAGVRGNYTKPENLHLTLAFIGEYSDPDQVLETMSAVPLHPFSLYLEGFGSFGSLYWCGIGQQEDMLSAYVRRLRHTLAENGIPFDRKGFRPHITLVRKVVQEEKRGLSFSGITVPAAETLVRSVSLMRSDRGKTGMIYTEQGCITAETSSF